MNPRLIAAAKKWGVDSGPDDVDGSWNVRPELDVAHEVLEKLPEIPAGAHWDLGYGRQQWSWIVWSDPAEPGGKGSFIDCICELAERLEVLK